MSGSETILRDMCYVNPENGEVRNRVTVKGGYAEIAGWLGMSRPKTIWEWLNEKLPVTHAQAGMYKNLIVRVYMSEIIKDETSLDFAGQSRAFDVLIEEIPREFLEVALTNPDGAIDSIAMARLSDTDGAIVSIGVARLSDMDGATVSIAMARLSDIVGATVRVLSSLTLKPNSLNSNNTTTLNTSNEKNDKVRKPKPVEEQGVVNLPSAWVLDRLLTQNKVHPKTQKTVRGGSAQGLVSWLLYALSPAGHGIDKPMNYALARLAEDPQGGAGDKYDTLASVPPAALIDTANKASRGNLAHALLTGETGDDLTELWMDVMGTKKDPALTLMRLLVGDIAPHRLTKISKSDRWAETKAGWQRVIKESIEEV